MNLDEKMKSIAVTDKEKVDILESDLPQVGSQDILVEIQGCMLCTFEQRIFKRTAEVPLPFVAGHEIVGEIAHLGSDIESTDWAVGQKVVIRLLHPCGECYYCRRNAENLCENANRANNRKNPIKGMGGLSEYISVEARQLWKISSDLDNQSAAFAEPLGCVVNSIQKADIQYGDDVVVIGGGIMGQLHVALASKSGARVILIEPNPDRRAIGSSYGADITFDPLEKNPIECIKELTGKGAEVVFDTIAFPKSAKNATEMAAPLGKVILYSSIHPNEDIAINPNDIHKSERIILGAVSPTIRSFNVAVNLLNKGIIDPRKLIHATYGFNQAQAAFEAAVQPDSLRVYIDFCGE